MSKENLIFGNKAVLEAILAGKSIDKIFIDKTKTKFHQNILHAIKENQIPYSIVPVAKLNTLVSQMHQGVVCILCPVPLVSLSNIIQNYL